MDEQRIDQRAMLAGRFQRRQQLFRLPARRPLGRKRVAMLTPDRVQPRQGRVRAAGSMDTTIDDMARLAAAVASGQLLAPALRQVFASPHLPITTASQFPTLQPELPAVFGSLPAPRPALVRGDVYHSDENLLTAIPGYRGKSGWQGRGIAAVAADMRWPFVGEFAGGTQTLTPRVQIVATVILLAAGGRARSPIRKSRSAVRLPAMIAFPAVSLSPKSARYSMVGP